MTERETDPEPASNPPQETERDEQGVLSKALVQRRIDSYNAGHNEDPALCVSHEILRDQACSAYARGFSDAREAAAKAICLRCAEGVKLDGEHHLVRDGLRPKGAPHRRVLCYAIKVWALTPTTERQP